ncbi:PIG-L family deacetylase [Mucilaginibacter celer]|uniref:PIG-L family deacetylase n=1 Tax=Mucilaginibacter celer TaxID=2305508 RepID=A0A494VU00_9SPHI|nr:PIG-L family deacetylase [Mucilaginibacter celer]AYL99066.1 PIG-L family deacetylase [Mucilaginibacter celer]
MKKYILLLVMVIGLGINTPHAQTIVSAPRALVVIAHPDDESTFSVTLYKIAKEQHGIVDLFVITNGEAGYKYSTLAEDYYGVKLTDEPVGRANLPRIRKKELVNAGKILGVNKYYFEDQLDAHFTLDEKEPLDTSWDVPAVKKRLNQVLKANHYDYVFTLLPTDDTHGGHKAATILAIDAVKELPAQNRPIILGATTTNKIDAVSRFISYKGYSETQTVADTALFKVDRTASFSYKNRLNYKVIANWEIAEHKSQGFTQMSMNDGDWEQFWYFAVNDKTNIQKTADFFNKLNITPCPVKTYPETKPVYTKF